jgi:hypothetical protein
MRESSPARWTLRKTVVNFETTPNRQRAVLKSKTLIAISVAALLCAGGLSAKPKPAEPQSHDPKPPQHKATPQRAQRHSVAHYRVVQHVVSHHAPVIHRMVFMHVPVGIRSPARPFPTVNSRPSPPHPATPRPKPSASPWPSPAPEGFFFNPDAPADNQ